jgi:hypothetical protein
MMDEEVSVTNDTAPLELRVRSYLDANCAQCHRPNGGVAFFDARFDTPLDRQGLINGPVANPLGIPGARIIVPDDPSKSILYHRIDVVGENQMPPLARNLVDTNAVATIAEWINSLPIIQSTLPHGWSHADIGVVGPQGDASALSGRFNVIASGSDIWGTNDGFHFAYVPISGNAQIIARVTAMQYTDPWAKAGVMFREGLGAGDKYSAMVVTAGGASAYQWRPTENDSGHNTDGTTIELPYWVKLVRQGDTFSGYLSKDGKNWHRVDDISVPMAKKIYMGLAVSAHNNTVLNSAIFDNVKVTK